MQKLWPVIAVLISGICWYFSFDLSGNYWYLLWFAPIPVLLISFQSSAKQSFVIAVTAYLIGRLSWLPYLLTVLPTGLAIFFTILIPVIFAFIVLLTRKIVLFTQSRWSVFAFPVLWCLFEFLVFNFSYDGTAGSIAYGQANYLPVIQVASVTGILGISFLVTLFPSAVAVTIYSKQSKRSIFSSVITFVLILISIVYGIVRINKTTPDESILTVGLAVVDEKFHSETNHPVAEHEIQVADLYAAAIARLAQQGVQVVVLPEKMMNVMPDIGSLVKAVIINAATTNHVAVVAGYTEFINDKTRHNNAMVISPQGNMLADYQKVKLFEGEVMNHFVPGNKIATFNLYNIASGVAICKDMDYQDFMRKYAVGNIQVLFVPAWDFVKDGWLHSRMAVLRGVENGYAIIRAARDGRLSISDYRGKILYEASTENNNAASLIGKIPLTPTQTIYSRFGDWFGYLDIIAAAYFIFILFRRRRSKPLQNTTTVHA
jgi:apolipoprotein N-acyltransferase